MIFVADSLKSNINANVTSLQSSEKHIVTQPEEV